MSVCIQASIQAEYRPSDKLAHPARYMSYRIYAGLRIVIHRTMKFFIRFSLLLVLLLLVVVLVWGVNLTFVPTFSRLHRPAEGTSEDAVQGRWLNYGTTLGPNSSSKQLSMQLPHDFNTTVQKGVLAERIPAHLPQLSSEGPPPSPGEMSLAEKVEERVVLYRKSEELLQSKDARKGRSIMHSSFAVEATISNKSDNHQDIGNFLEHPNMEIRGKYQQEAISDFCHRHQLDDLTGTLPDGPTRNDFFRRIILDEQHRALFCFMPKVGCTNMRISLLVSSRRVTPAVLGLKDRKDYLEKKLERALKKASFLSRTLTNETMLMMIAQFQKFTIIRHPLERLASAYRDKMSKPLPPVLNKKRFTYFDRLKHSIMQEYEPYLYQKWEEEGKRTNLSVSFPIFVTWLTERSSSEVVNEHFTMQVDNCQPCRMRYHFYGNFKTFVNDSLQILSKFTNNLSAFSDQGYYRPGLETRQLLPAYFSQFTLGLKERLLKHMELELDFYHSLYPSEKQLTQDLLGLS